MSRIGLKMLGERGVELDQAIGVSEQPCGEQKHCHSKQRNRARLI